MVQPLFPIFTSIIYIYQYFVEFNSLSDEHDEHSLIIDTEDLQLFLFLP